MRRTTFIALCVLALCAAAAAGQGKDIYDDVENHYADNDGVKIHYVTYGEGPVVLFVHGFPDFWYSWRHQMAGLGDAYKTVAMDLRGYNHSDQPDGVDPYRMPLLLADVTAVIDDLGAEDVTLVGHDWGGAISWPYANVNPKRVNTLIICDLTHPRGYANVIANATPEQRANTEYARGFRWRQPTGDAEHGNACVAVSRPAGYCGRQGRLDTELGMDRRALYARDATRRGSLGPAGRCGGGHHNNAVVA